MYEVCEKISPNGFLCELKANHKGQHEAYGGYPDPLDVWEPPRLVLDPELLELERELR